MRLNFALQDRQALAQAERHLDSANRCLVRQLRALSRVGRHTSEVNLAEAVLRTMMDTHQLILESQQALEQLQGSSPNRRSLKSKLSSLASNSDPNQEATLLLRSKKLRAGERCK